MSTGRVWAGSGVWLDTHVGHKMSVRRGVLTLPEDQRASGWQLHIPCLSCLTNWCLCCCIGVCRELGCVSAEVLAELRYNLPATMRFHKCVWDPGATVATTALLQTLGRHEQFWGHCLCLRCNCKKVIKTRSLMHVGQVVSTSLMQMLCAASAGRAAWT